MYVHLHMSPCICVCACFAHIIHVLKSIPQHYFMCLKFCWSHTLGRPVRLVYQWKRHLTHNCHARQTDRQTSVEGWANNLQEVYHGILIIFFFNPIILSSGMLNVCIEFSGGLLFSKIRIFWTINLICAVNIYIIELHYIPIGLIFDCNWRSNLLKYQINLKHTHKHTQTSIQHIQMYSCV